MSQVWIKVVNLSIQASWLVLAIILFRLAAAKAPKWSRVLLWGLVGIRLVCPVTLESMLSFVPSAETISPDIMTQTDPSVETGIPVVNNTVNPLINYSFSPNPGDSANPLQILIPLLSVIWLAGIGLLIIYTIVSYARLRYRLATAVHLRNNIWQSEWVTSPFVFGLMHPKIYLPFALDEQTQQAVTAHKQAHLQRKDHWWTPLGFVILSVYWFNPLPWIGYLLFCRDIELACDEKAVREMDASQRADYSQALLDCTAHRHKVSVCPLAFGEVGIQQRVKAVLRYKKPTTWMVAGVIPVKAGKPLYHIWYRGFPEIKEKEKRKYQRLLFLMCLSCSLKEFNIISDYLNRLVNTDTTAIDAQVIIFSNAPFAVGIETVIVGTFFIHLLDFFRGVDHIDFIDICCAVNTIVHIGTNEDINDVMEFFQNIISTPSNDNTAALSSNILNNLSLYQKYLVIQRKIGHAGDAMHNTGADGKGIQ